MDRCQFYIQCGNQDRYECNHSGRTEDNSRVICYSQKLEDVAWAELARVAETIDDELEELDRRTMRAQTPNIEFTTTVV